MLSIQWFVYEEHFQPGVPRRALLPFNVAVRARVHVEVLMLMLLPCKPRAAICPTVTVVERYLPCAKLY